MPTSPCKLRALHSCPIFRTSRSSRFVHIASRHGAQRNARSNWKQAWACRQTRRRHCCSSVVTASSASTTSSDQGQGFDYKLAANVGLVLVLGVLNRVFNKLATVPMSDYLFFLAQLQTFGYVVFYGTILTIRKKAGKVPPEMNTAVQKKKFATIGGLEAVAQVVGMLCVSKLPGVILPLISQTVLLWQAALGYIFLGQRYTKLQLGGILLVVGGVAKAAWPQGADGGILGQTNPLYAVLFGVTFLLLAGCSLVKDLIFREGQKNLNGRKLDLFIVNTYGSLAQAGFVLLLLPVMTSLKKISLRQLPQYLKEGGRAFLGQLEGTDGAPMLPLGYIAINLAFNIATLNLVRTSGALVATLSLSALIPLTIVAFTFEWPLIGAAASLNQSFVIGTAMLLSGLIAYNWEALAKQKTS